MSIVGDRDWVWVMIEIICGLQQRLSLNDNGDYVWMMIVIACGRRQRLGVCGDRE